MWRAILSAIFYICLIFPPDVKGSCLEYGHSCWGAHGKRSSGPAIAGNKVKHGLDMKNFRSYELNVLGDDNTNRNVENKVDIDEALASAESLLSRAVSSEDFSGDMNDAAKARSRLKFPKYVIDSESNSVPMGESKRNKNRADTQEEREQQQQRKRQQGQSSLPLQQQRKYPQHAERWRRFPIYAIRHSFGNSPLALTDTATPLEIPARNSENDFIQQFGQLSDGRLDDVDAFYDVL